MRTIVTWNGDRKFHEELVYAPETFIHKECDANWTCSEGKGSRRFWYRAFQKPSGLGFVLVKVAGLYESIYWDSISLLNEDLRQTPLAELKPGCQDFYSDGTQLIVVEALVPTNFDPMVKFVDAKATIYDATSGRPSGSAEMKNLSKWKLLLRNECGLNYSE
ncbi:MAG: hypothetical protein SF051_10845 [Elusimicrobiota bacterium]|nr:hypothetical protein [Elusimicrobiota bacterium]